MTTTDPERSQVLAGLQDLYAKWHSPPAELVSQIPAGNGRPALDYLGHADTTRAILEADPFWSWAPLALEDGLPKIVERDNLSELWIELTVRGVTRLGCGTAPTSKPELVKELIGDAIRNAAMRFGVALDLWSKAGPDVYDSAPERVSLANEAGQKQRLVELLEGDTELAAAMWAEIEGAVAGMFDRAEFDAFVTAFRLATDNAAAYVNDEFGGMISPPSRVADAMPAETVADPTVYGDESPFTEETPS